MSATRAPATRATTLNQSIHPFRPRGVSNTCKQKSPGTIERVRNAITGHLARHPRDSVAAAHLAKLA